mmetsp:Transcript_42167/g.101423  ORF Transcript_42167/g.101423 Transcript_42167/m.101423 type:complete len:308 (-) Transcript_42167:1729-2652(-)
MTSLLHLQQSRTIVDGVERIGEDKRQDSHQLHDNVQGRSRRILERVTNCISDNGGLVDVRSLTLQFRVGRLLFDVLLGIVPGTSRVGHGNGKLNSSNQGTDEKTTDSSHTEQNTSQKRGEDNHGTGGDHLLQRSLCGNSNAGIVVRAFSRVLVKEVGLLIELALDFHNHLHGSTSDRLHCQSSEGEGDHTTDDEECESDRFEHVHTISEQLVARRMADTGHECTEESQRHKGGRTNGETLSDSSSGVSCSIQSICFFTNTWVQLSHLSNTSSVITDRTVNINGQTSCQVRKETDSGKRNTVHITGSE